MVVFVFLCTSTLIGQTGKKQFKLRYTTEQQAQVAFIANSILGCEGCNVTNEIAPTGKGDNNAYKGKYIDIDDVVETFSSSSANINLSECSKIVFAGLYWGGAVSPVNPRYSSRNRVKLKLPGSAVYLDLTADEVLGWQYYKDITSLFSNIVKKGAVTIANVVVDEEQQGGFAGWTIVIVYQDEFMPLKNISLYDGIANIGTNASADFIIPRSGLVPYSANVDIGFVTYDGDRGGFGDFLLLNGQRISDQLHDANNLFNSSITNRGIRSDARSPNYNNTLGYDASIISSSLPDTHDPVTASFRTVGDGYSLGVFMIAMDIYTPTLTFSHCYRNLSSDLQTVKAGEALEFEYNIKNIGNDKSLRTIFTDTIPSLLEYVHGSTEVQYDNGVWLSISDKGGDDAGWFNENDRSLSLLLGVGSGEANSEVIPPGSTVKVRYRAKMTGDCEALECAKSPLSKNGWIQYSGEINADYQSKICSSPKSECCNRQPLSIPFNVCEIPSAIVVKIYCSTEVSKLPLPNGYTLFRSDDYDFKSPLTTVAEPGLYKARRVLSSGCEFSFNVQVSKDTIVISQQPMSLEKCEGDEAPFSATVKGPALKYQWQTASGLNKWTDLPNCNKPSLSLSPVTSSMNNNRYRLMISSPCGDVLFSEAANLSVKQPESVPSSTPGNTPPPFGSLYVPNAFMPASRTTELRSFMVKGMGLSKWEMKIMNKWDQVIWQTDRLDANGTPVEGWDGKINGVDAPQGAYMWVISAVFPDGSEWKGMCLRSGRPRKSGIVYLIR